MKALILKDIQTVQITELPIPAISDHQVLVRNHFCAVCNATDTKMYNGKHATVRYPSVIGHEGSGIIAAVGAAVSSVQPGDRILGAGYPSSEQLGSFWGQYAEYGVTDDSSVVRIPDAVSLEQATLAHMLGEALNALEISGAKIGDNLLIIGCGAVGLSILTVALHSYANRIIMIDISDDKLRLAEALGASHTINSSRENVAETVQKLTGGSGVKVVFEAVGSPATYQLAYDLVNENGTIVPFGLIEGVLEVPFRRLYAKQIQIRWCRAAGNHGQLYRKIILDMLAKGLINPDPLITGIHDLADFELTIREIQAGKHIRTLIRI